MKRLFPLFHPLLTVVLSLGILLLPDDAQAIILEGGCDAGHVASLVPADNTRHSAVSFCEHGDQYQGRLTLKLTAAELENIDILYAGYITGSDVRLTLLLPGEKERLLTTREKGEIWSRLPVPDLSGLAPDTPVEVHLTDESSRWTGWGGLAVTKKPLLGQPLSNYTRTIGRTLAILFLLLAPGVFLMAWQRTRMNIAFLPIPGTVLLALAGTGYWAAPRSVVPALQVGLYVLYAAIMIATLIALCKDRGAIRLVKRDARFCLLAFCLCFAQAMLYGSNPLPVAQEYGEGTPLPGRMVASPPDHGIPYQTSLYMYKRYDGVEQSSAYFGEWNIASRGPLVPLGINALYHLLDPQARLGENEHGSSWPESAKGAKYASIYGWLLNASVVMGCFYLIGALTTSVYWQRIALTWVVVSPVITINTVFLWPKLLAVYFVLLAVGALLRQRPALSGSCMALAWLSHPVGALMLPAVFLFGLALHLTRLNTPAIRRATKDSLRFCLALGALMGPWLLYKASLGHPDVLFSYVLGGGRGTLPADSIQQWLSVRWSNFWLTLSPAAFFYSGNMHQWLYGALSEPLRWTIQYAKTLPGAIGFLAYPVALSALLSSARHARQLNLVRSFLIIGAFLIMLVFWGFSGDGLGRNSLEPVSVLLMLYVVASKTPARRFMPVLLWSVALESLYVQFSGMLFHNDFAFSNIKADTAVLMTANTLLFAALVIIGTRKTPLMERS